MGYIFAIILVFMLAVVGFDGILIALVIGGVCGIVSLIIERHSSKPKYKQQISKKKPDDNEEIINNMILLETMEDEEDAESLDDENYSDYWETHCESCGELLEDCECDWQNESKTDISEDIDDLEFDEINDILEEDEEF